MTGPDDGGLGPEFFERMYADTDDPWGFRTRAYEVRKRAVTMACLPQQRFASAFEPGCSVGMLTEQLAGRCDRLLATDVVPEIVEVARAQVAAYPHVTVEVGAVPQDWPPGRFDLVVVSEVGYYLSSGQLAALAEQVRGSLTDDGVLLACHWRHPVAEYPRSGDEVHEVLRTGLAPLVTHVEDDFVLEVLGLPPVRSAAQRSGLRG